MNLRHLGREAETRVPAEQGPCVKNGVERWTTSGAMDERTKDQTRWSLPQPALQPLHTGAACLICTSQDADRRVRLLQPTPAPSRISQFPSKSTRSGARSPVLKSTGTGYVGNAASLPTWRYMMPKLSVRGSSSSSAHLLLPRLQP